jgi:hypothetical protein
MIKYGLMLSLIATSSVSVANVGLIMASTLRVVAAGNAAPRILEQARTHSTLRQAQDSGRPENKDIGFEHHQKQCAELDKREKSLWESVKQLDMQYLVACKNEENQFNVEGYLSARKALLEDIKAVKDEKAAALHD